MSSLSIAALVLGLVFVAMYLPILLAPERARDALRAFSRNALAAGVLSAVDLFWVAVLILQTDLDRFEYLKPLVYVLGPLSFYLVNKYMDELLAPRALGGFLLLAATPILDAARWHDSPARLLVTLIAYIGVVKGILFVLSPYRFRDFVNGWMTSIPRVRAGAAFGLVLGGSLILLAFSVYR